MLDLSTAPLQRLRSDWLTDAGVELAVLRLDLIDPEINGNKPFKLAGHLQRAREQGARCLASLGGPHSNHLHALAAATRRLGLPSIGLLRGEPQDTPTVRDLQAFGMQLHWLGYGGYRQRHQPGFWDPWRERYPGLYAIDEGGGGLDGALGCQVWPAMVESQLDILGWSDFDGWWLAVGTGTSLAGLVLAERGRRPVYGALAVPADHGVPRRLAAILAQAQRADEGYRLIDASRGGFARIDAELASFLRDCEEQGLPPLEPLYTGKALMALRHQLRSGYFPPGSRLVFVHSGGLQGRRALDVRQRELAAGAAR